MDPRLIIKLGSCQQQTEEHPRGGKVPDWKGEELIFQLGHAEQLYYSVMDDMDDPDLYDIVGSNKIAVESLPHGGQPMNLPIYHNDKKVGTVKISVEFDVESTVRPEQMQQEIKLGEMADCDHCFMKKRMIIFCDQCKKVGYCSKQCHEAAVKEESHVC